MEERGFIEKSILCSLGAIALAEEKISKVLGELEQKGEKKQKELAQQLKKKESIAKMESTLNKAAKRLLKKLDIPTYSEIKELKSEIKSLKEMLEKNEKSQR